MAITTLYAQVNSSVLHSSDADMGKARGGAGTVVIDNAASPYSVGAYRDNPDVSSRKYRFFVTLLEFDTSGVLGIIDDVFLRLFVSTPEVHAVNFKVQARLYDYGTVQTSDWLTATQAAALRLLGQADTSDYTMGQWFEFRSFDTFKLSIGETTTRILLISKRLIDKDDVMGWLPEAIKLNQRASAGTDFDPRLTIHSHDATQELEIIQEASDDDVVSGTMTIRGSRIEDGVLGPITHYSSMVLVGDRKLYELELTGTTSMALVGARNFESTDLDLVLVSPSYLEAVVQP